MKPHRLTISGLQSFREQQEIDFDRLTDRGMFGIFGPTGSGKSTILDAMTLALYGRVGRAKSGKQGIVNESETIAAVSFCFSMGIGKTRTTYRVERRYRTKDHVAVTSTLSRLVEVSPAGESVLADQESTVTAKLEDILGITLDDFVRAVVLPQGKFADFLTLKGVDRRRMLERLFSLERFGEQLAGRVKSRREAAAARQGQLSGELQGMGDASAEAVAAVRQQLQLSRAAAETALTACDEVRRLHAAAAQIVGLQQSLQDTSQKLTNHLANEAEIVQAEQRIAVAQAALEIQPWLTKVDEVRSVFARTTAVETEAKLGRQAALANAAACRQEYDQFQSARQVRAPELTIRRVHLTKALEMEADLAAEEKKRIVAASELQQITAKLEAAGAMLASQEQKLTARDQDLADGRRKLAVCQTSHERRSQINDALAAVLEWENGRQRIKAATMEHSGRLKELQLARDVLQERLGAEQKNRADMAELDAGFAKALSSCPVDTEQLAATTALLDRLEIQLGNLAQQESEVQALKSRLASLRREYSQAVTAAKAADEAAHDAETAQERDQRAYHEALQNDRRRMAALLAVELSDGESCPVCGSTAHPRLAQPMTEASGGGRLQALKITGEKSQAVWKAAAALATAAREKVSALAAQGQAEAENLQQRSERLETLRGEATIINKLPGSENVEPSAASYQAWLTDQRIRLKTDRQVLSDWQEQRDRLISQREARQKTALNLAAELAAARMKETAAATELDKARLQLTAVEAEVDAVAQRVGETAQALVLAADLPVEAQAGRIRKLAEDLNQSDAIREELERQQGQLQDERDGLGVEVNGLRQAAVAVEVDRARQADRLKSITEALELLRKDWRSVTGGESAQRLLAEIEVALAELQLQDRTLQTAWDNADRQRQTADAEFAAAAAAKLQAQTSLDLAENQLNRELVAAKFANEKAARAAVIPAELLRSQRLRIEEYREQQRQLETQVSQFKQELAGRGITGQEWEVVQQSLAGHEADSKEKHRAEIEAAQTYRMLNAKHGRWQEIQTELSSQQRLLDRLDKIFGLIRGNMLVEYLAQEQMKIVLHNASERLKQLTHNRYALEIDSEGAFIVRDDANGGVRRPATSLSGGETFQTSLALALALSDQIQLRGQYPLEFFFLDEGFGSLDSKALEVAMATLERLRHDRLTIGIISHVEDLQQRMPRRLVVTPPDLAGNGSRVHLEIA